MILINTLCIIYLLDWDFVAMKVWCVQEWGGWVEILCGGTLQPQNLMFGYFCYGTTPPPPVRHPPGFVAPPVLPRKISYDTAVGLDKPVITALHSPLKIPERLTSTNLQQRKSFQWRNERSQRRKGGEGWMGELELELGKHGAIVNGGR